MTEKLTADLNLCRCCALEHNVMYDLFCGTCSNAQTYYEVIRECASIQLMRDDGLPSLICHKCVLILESVVVFRKKCIESELILKQMSKNISPDKRQTPDSNRVKQDDPLDIVKKESNDIDEPEKNYLSEEYLELKSSDEIKIENMTVNENAPTGVKPYTCDEYEESFDFERNLNLHWKTHTGPRPYACNKCKKSFDQRGLLIRHQKIHTRSCGVCGKSYSRKWDLDAHQKIHKGEIPHPCDNCGKSFNRKADLNIHRKTHTGEKPYPCDRCDRSFVRIALLNQHRKTHTGEMPYPCDWCDRSFIQKASLVQHQNRHTGEKPYPCDRCHKSFYWKASLVQHQKTHKGEKPSGEVL